MTILYYTPGASHSRINSEWLYGKDIIDKLIRDFPDWTWINCIDFDRLKLRELYQKADYLLRPTRHDGYSLMVQEAIYYGLKVIHTQKISGVIFVKPEFMEIKKILDKG